MGVNFQTRELLFIYHFILLFIDVEIAKTPAERAREYRVRKKLLRPQKPPPQTRAQRNRKYMAQQKALRNDAPTIGENETMTNFSGSLELPTVNPNNPQSSISRDDNNILYNYLSQTNGQSGQVPVENAQEIKVVQADMHQVNLFQCAVNPISTTTKMTRKSCTQRCEYRQRLKMMAEANGMSFKDQLSPIMNVSSNVSDIQVDPAQMLQPETILMECDLSAASVVRQGNYG